MTGREGIGRWTPDEKPDIFKDETRSLTGEMVLEKVIDVVGDKEEADGHDDHRGGNEQRMDKSVPLLQESEERKCQNGKDEQEPAFRQEGHQNIEQRVRHAVIDHEEQRYIDRGDHAMYLRKQDTPLRPRLSKAGVESPDRGRYDFRHGKTGASDV